MKLLLVIALTGLFLCSSAFAQDKPAPQTPQSNVEALLQTSEHKLDQMESLEQLYDRLSAEVTLSNALADNILGGTSTRARCTAECAGDDVTCSGENCTAIDDVGCVANDDEGNPTFKLCGKVAIVPVE